MLGVSKGPIVDYIILGDLKHDWGIILEYGNSYHNGNSKNYYNKEIN